ncbi:peptidylprolyl isomerase [Geitlerinema splendidum]|nr:peptidylprolyl isomerase [Geitlerinema splendidum]
MKLSNIEAEAFLSIGDQDISLSKALNYLRASGDLQVFLVKIIRQHLIEQELETSTSLKIYSSQIDQAVIDLRSQNHLINTENFESWLQLQQINYDDLRHQIEVKLKLEKLKADVAAPKLNEYFNANKALLDQIILSRIVVTDKDLAHNLRDKILEDNIQFDSLAREHSLTDDRLLNGMMGLLNLGQIPEQIREFVVTATPGELIGPLEIDGRYALLRVEQILPASLEGSLKQQLQEQLFDQWLQEKAQNMIIKMHVE